MPSTRPHVGTRVPVILELLSDEALAILARDTKFAIGLAKEAISTHADLYTELYHLLVAVQVQQARNMRPMADPFATPNPEDGDHAFTPLAD